MQCDKIAKPQITIPQITKPQITIPDIHYNRKHE